MTKINCTANLSFEDALDIANGCFDYMGGYHNKEELEIYHHGMQTVINVLEAAKASNKKGMEDLQVKTIHKLGKQKRNENNGWIDWNGGTCPVPEETMVEYQMREDSFVDRQPAKYLDWNNSGVNYDIIKYRIVE